jgi:hypothetical protein
MGIKFHYVGREVSKSKLFLFFNLLESFRSTKVVEFLSFFYVILLLQGREREHEVFFYKKRERERNLGLNV